ncbi:MAG: hypothetical protein JW881_21930 [Spirochaetales bacterium]|nr:hypothetical protein [Spirochaetales bacterium]
MSFWDRMQKIINDGIDASKEMLNKAKEKAQDLGEIGILKFEISQLEKQAEKNFLLLGSRVYEIFVEKQEHTIKNEQKEVKDIIQEILNIKKKIEEKEEILKNI